MDAGVEFIDFLLYYIVYNLRGTICPIIKQGDTPPPNCANLYSGLDTKFRVILQ